MPVMLNGTAGTEAGEAIISKINLADYVTPEMVSGVLDQTAGMLPVLLPAAIMYLGFRKALGFTFQMLRMA